MTITDFSNSAFSIAMQGNVQFDQITLNLTSFDGSTFVANLTGKLEVQPNVGGFMSRPDAIKLQAFLATVLGA